MFVYLCVKYSLREGEVRAPSGFNCLFKQSARKCRSTSAPNISKWCMRASAASSASTVLSGYSETHRENMSMMVKMYLYPSGSSGRGPIVSILRFCIATVVANVNGRAVAATLR